MSRPMLIALAATLVLAASWMAFLRPRAVESTTDQVNAPARVATQAAKAAAATDKASAATEAATKAVESATTPASPAPTAKTETGTATTAKPKTVAPATGGAAAPAKPADGQAEVLHEMESGKVVVLLFWDKSGADDRAARDAVTKVDRRHGKVTVHAVAIDEVGEYGSVTQGVNVTRSPATLVISPNGTARIVSGLTERTEVDQLVRDALAAK